MAEISSVNMAKFRYLSGVFVGLFWWYRGVLSAPILQFPFILQDSKSSSLASFLFHHLIVKEYFSISFHFFSFTKSYVSKTALLNHVCPFKLCSLWSPLPVVRALICLNMIFRPFRPTGIPLLSFMQFISISHLSYLCYNSGLFNFIITSTPSWWMRKNFRIWRILHMNAA